MPCAYHETPYDRQLSHERAELDLVTRLLCSVCENVDVSDIILAADLELQEWWAKHQRLDAKREASELAVRDKVIAKKTALNKLSAKERKLLGVE